VLAAFFHLSLQLLQTQLLLGLQLLFLRFCFLLETLNTLSFLSNNLILSLLNDFLLLSLELFDLLSMLLLRQLLDHEVIVHLDFSDLFKLLLHHLLNKRDHLGLQSTRLLRQ
jgi:hypothetical protein